MEYIHALRAELNTVNAECFGLKTRVAELEEELLAVIGTSALQEENQDLLAINDALRTQVAELKAENEELLTLNDALISGLTEVATRPLHRIVATRLALNALLVALAVKNNEHVQNFTAVPKFVAGQAATKAKALWAKVPSLRAEALRRTSRLGPSVS